MLSLENKNIHSQGTVFLFKLERLLGRRDLGRVVVLQCCSPGAWNRVLLLEHQMTVASPRMFEWDRCAPKIKPSARVRYVRKSTVKPLISLFLLHFSFLETNTCVEKWTTLKLYCLGYYTPYTIWCPRNNIYRSVTELACPCKNWILLNFGFFSLRKSKIGFLNPKTDYSFLY